MDAEIKKKIDELGTTVTNYKTENEKRLEELEKKGFETAETKAKFEAYDKTIDGLKETVDSLHAAFNKKSKTIEKGGKEYTELELEHKKAFDQFVRKGDRTLFDKLAMEHKELSVISAEDGGFLVPYEMSSEIVKRAFDTSPIRDLISSQTISTASLEMIEDLDEMEAGWVAERDERAETDTPKLNKLIIPVHEIFAQPAASQKVLEDASINMEAWLGEKAGDKFSRLEATAFVLGNGEGKPRGFMTYADGDGKFGTVERLKTGVNGGFKADPDGGDSFIDLAQALKEVYRRNAYWGMHRSTCAAVRKFKTSDGQYIWQPSLQAGKPDMIAGLPIRELDDMVKPASFAAGSLPVVLADFRAAYQAVDRRGITLLRDPYTRKGFVLFYFTKRVGGGVKNFDAIKILELSA